MCSCSPDEILDFSSQQTDQVIFLRKLTSLSLRILASQASLYYKLELSIFNIFMMIYHRLVLQHSLRDMKRCVTKDKIVVPQPHLPSKCRSPYISSFLACTLLSNTFTNSKIMLLVAQCKNFESKKTTKVRNC